MASVPPRRPPPPCEHDVLKTLDNEYFQCLRCREILALDELDRYTEETMRRNLFRPVTH